jgi:hypothetical protein
MVARMMGRQYCPKRNAVCKKEMQEFSKNCMTMQEDARMQEMRDAMPEM